MDPNKCIPESLASNSFFGLKTKGSSVGRTGNVSMNTSEFIDRCTHSPRTGRCRRIASLRCTRLSGCTCGYTTSQLFQSTIANRRCRVTKKRKKRTKNETLFLFCRTVCRFLQTQIEELCSRKNTMRQRNTTLRRKGLG